MSEQKPITKVPDGQTRFYTTRQKAPNEKGFVGYETVWKPFQKEVEYKVTRFYTTRPKAQNEKGFVGYETVWKPFQKEVEYKTPKKP